MKPPSFSHLVNLSFAALAVFLPYAAPAAPVVRSVGGDATVVSITPTRDTFRLDLGGGTVAGANGSFGGVRREINWDAVPGTSAAPNPLAANFFNTTSPRGAVFSTPGTGFEVSGATTDAGAGQPAAARFGDLNATYTAAFGVFTAQRLFTALGSRVTDVAFFLPGTATPATVSGFGAVFTDVDAAGSTTIQYFDQADNSLGIFTVPVGTVASASLSFLGVSFNGGERISRVRITSGNTALGAGVNDNPGGGVDLVVMDDFIYSEPVSCQTIFVDAAGGNDANSGTTLALAKKTIQAGINAACPGGTVFVKAGTYTPTASLLVNKNLSIVGDAASTTFVSGSGNGGNSVFRINSILANPGPTVLLSGLTVLDGDAPGGGGIFNQQYATLTVANCTISGNQSFTSGGGIFNDATLTIANSTISGNQAVQFGGGIFNNGGSLTVANSTISGNQASGAGGGGIDNIGSLTVANTTITGNRCGSGGAGGLYAGSTETLNNSIVADNFIGAGSTSSDIAGGTVNTASHNLIGDADSAGGIANSVNGNIVGNNGVGTLDITTILNTALANNGGPTMTHALVGNSPALNHGDNTLIPPDFADQDADSNTVEPSPDDQRGPGFARLVNTTVDIGAFEVPFVVTTTSLTASPNPSVGGQSVTFTATVAPSPGALGTVAFRDNGVPIPGGAGVALSGGVAVFSTSSLALGNHPITAVYSGDANFATSTSAPLTQTVNPPGEILYALTDANALVKLDSGAPGALLNGPMPITGLAGDTLVGIDFRPANGQLYGLGGFNRLYTINTNTGAATLVAVLSSGLGGTDFGMDFNPVADRLRVVSDADQNLRVNPDTGVVTVDANLNPGNPNVTAVAYGNNNPGAVATTLYGIDSGTDTLVIQNPPDSGILTLVGALGVNLSSVSGFDISGRSGTAYAALTVGGISRLYTVNLATGAATLVGSIGPGGYLIRGLSAVPASADYTVTAVGSSMVVTDLAGNGDILTVSQPNAGEILFAAPGRTFSVNGGVPIAGNSGNRPLAGVTNIIVNAGAGADIMNVGGFSGLPSLTLNGGTGDDAVNFNGTITFAAGASLDVDLQNDDATPGVDSITLAPNAHLRVSGSGTITVKCSRNVVLNSGSSLETVNGNLTVEANQQATPTAGNFVGVDVANGLIQATGTGVVTVKGKGGTDVGGNQYGVIVSSGGDILGGTSGLVTVQGTGGGASGSSHNVGVVVLNTGATITSSGGNVQVTGQGGGTGTSATGYGVLLQGGCQVSAGGSGTVTVQGTGGAGSGVFNDGVDLLLTGPTITSGGGNVQVTGIEGAGSGSGAIFAEGSGVITTAANGGTLTLIGNSMAFDSTTTISAQPGSSVTLRQRSNAVGINLGSGIDPSSGPLSLSDAELDRITAGTLIIGDANSGAITISAAISPANVAALRLVTPGTIADLNTVGPDVTVTSLTTSGTLAPGASPGLFSVAGNETLAANSAFTVEIGGTAPGTQYDQLSASGSVTIGANVTLNLLAFGGFSPSAGQSFMIISRTGGSGTFAGLPQGTILANFLGSCQSAIISYAGGSGDDVVLTVLGPCLQLTKNCNSVVVGGGQTVSGTVTNCGNITLTNITIVDNFYGTLGTVASLAPGASQAYSQVVTSACFNSPNVVTATGTSTCGTPVSANAVTVCAAATYVWNQTGTAAWTTAGNWTPPRTTPATNDILVFNNGANTTVTGVPTQTNKSLQVLNNTILNLQAVPTATRTLTISGGAEALAVAGGSQLTVSGATALILSLPAGSSGSICGSMTFAGGAHRLVAFDANGITFRGGAIFTADTGFSGNAFGTANLNSVIFANGSTYVFRAGSDPFGAGQPNSVVVFQAGSLYSHQSASTPSFSGRTYANFELNAPATVISGTGSNPLSIDNLTITAGTLNLGMTGPYNQKGNILIQPGTTLNFNAASPATLSLNGSSAQTISGSGTLIFGANESVTVDNTVGVTLQRDLSIPGALTVNGTLNLGAFNLTGAGTVTVNAPGLLKGSGTISGPLVLNGTLSPGGSPGILTTANEAWNGGGHYTWEINDVDAGEGVTPGWDLLNLTSGLTINAIPGNKFNLDITSLTLANIAGNVNDFNNAAIYTWRILRSATPIRGFDTNAINLNIGSFSNPLGIGGRFTLETNNLGKDLILRFVHPLAITCPPNVLLQCGGDTNTSNAGVATAGTDCAGGAVTITYTDALTAPNCTGRPGVNRTWKATDACGGTVTCVQNITFEDTTPPVITCAPNRTNQCGTAWTFNDPTATDNCGTAINLVGTVTNATCGATFVATRTWRAMDNCGNFSTCSQVVAVVDTTPPAIACPADLTVECGSPWSFGTPLAEDTCFAGVPVYRNISNDLAKRFDPGTNEVGNEIILAGVARDLQEFTFQYWSTNDAVANAANLNGNVTVRLRFYANDGPAFNGFPTPGTLLYDNGELPLPTATTGRSTLTYDAADLGVFAVHPLVTLIPDSFTWTVQFSGLGAQDRLGVDLYSPPTVGQVNGDYWQRTSGVWQLLTNSTPPFLDANFGAAAQAGTNFVTITLLNTVTNQTCGNAFVARRTWRATDSCGNFSDCSQSVFVVDHTPPSLTVICAALRPCHTNNADAIADVLAQSTAVDTCCATPTVTAAVTGGTLANPVITVTATDCCGNEANKTCTAHVDGTPPLITGCPSGLVTPPCNAQPTCANALALLTITDNSDPNPTVVCQAEPVLTNGCQRSQIFRVTATDNCNNSSLCVVPYTWTADTAPPVFTQCPAMLFLSCNPTNIPDCNLSATNIAAADDCGTPNITCSKSDFVTSDGCNHDRTLTYTATDGCGNSSTCVQHIFWTTDTTPPTFTQFPADASLGCNPAAIPDCNLNATNVLAQDLCGTPVITCNRQDQTIGCQRTRIITYTATDPCNNSVSRSQTITWTVATAPPVFTNCPVSVNLGCNPASIPGCNPGVGARAACGVATVSCSAVDVINGCVHTRTISYTAVDGCNNSSTCTQVVSWTVATPPVFTNCPASANLGCNPASIPGCDPGVGATAACGAATVSCAAVDETNGCGRTRTIIYVAVDACNNSSICVQVLTWTVATTPSVFTNCPSDRDLGCDPVSIPGCDPGVGATSPCGPATVTCAVVDATNGCSRTRTLTYTAVGDACNVSSTCKQVISWSVTVPPVLSIEVQRTTMSVVISWPVTCCHPYFLEEATSLTPLVTWVRISPPVAVINGRETVIFPIGAGNKYYRLSYP